MSGFFLKESEKKRKLSNSEGFCRGGKKPVSFKGFVSFICLFLIKFYRLFFSLHFGGACRFYPSCSLYAEAVFSSHPPRKALILTLKRLKKCRFFGPFGWDPAPLELFSKDKL